MKLSKRAFTLVELLVVIAIIATLLAMLTPALDQAVYQAELAACAGNLHALDSAVNCYTGDYKRRYPYRPNLDGRDAIEPSYIRDLSNPPHDDRAPLSGYMGYQNYNDPLAGKLDFSPSQTWTDTFASYDLWYGFRFTVDGGYPGMYKMGDRFSFAYDHYGTGVRTYTFDLLAGDSDIINSNSSQAGMEINHPDHEGVLTQMVLQNQTQTNVPSFLPVAVKVAARWVNWGGRQRGLIDQNFAHADGSVNRLTDVRGGEGATAGYLNDPRTVPVPRWNSSYNLAGSWMWNHIPAER